MEEKSNRPNWFESAIKQYDREGFEDGDMISKEWIDTYLEIPIPQTISEGLSLSIERMQRVEMLKDFLLTERDIALETVRGKGYRIVPPKEQSLYAIETCMKHVNKGLEKGMKISQHTRMHRLDIDQQRRHVDTQIKMRSLSDFVNRKNKDLFSAFKLKRQIEA